MASHLEVLLGNIHECLDIGAVEAFPIILDLKSTVEGLSDHDLGRTFSC